MSQAQSLGKTPRQSRYDINPLLLHRWSPRAMSGEEISDTELMRLFEAARWAPSSYNGQPWRFIYAKRNSEPWDKLFSLMVDFNKSWAKNAAALVVIISRKNFEHDEKPSVTHQFDAGAAWENLALQGETYLECCYCYSDIPGSLGQNHCCSNYLGRLYGFHN